MITNPLFQNHNKFGGKSITSHPRIRKRDSTNRRVKPSSMAFWGALVRTDEPLNVVLDRGAHRRLHVSQAALGRCRDRKTECKKGRNRLYCKVGENPRVLLCTFRFNGTEMCSLDLEFTAPDKVVFSVVGIRDIHISGYYFNEFPRPFTIMPQHQIVPLSNREEVKTSRDTFVLECPQGDGPQIGDQDAPMQHVGEIGKPVGAHGPAEESALRDGGDQHINLVQENRSPSTNSVGIVTQASEHSLMNIRASGQGQPILASGWKEMQNFQELLMHICYRLLTKVPSVMNWINMAPSLTGKEVQEMSQGNHPLLGCIKCEMRSPRLGERCTSDDEVNPIGNLVQDNSGSRIMKIFELEQPSKIIEDESERPAEESALHDGADQHMNLVEENRTPIINKCLGIGTQASQQSLMNIGATGQRQQILGSGWKDVQNLPELLMHICYCLLTKVPHKMDWTNIGLSFRSNGVEEMLHVSYPTMGSFKRGMKSARHMENITLYELEPPGNIIEEKETERLVDKQNIKPKRKKITSKGLSACEDDFDAVHLESAHAEKAKDRHRDGSRLVDEDRLKPKRKRRKTHRNSISVGLTSIRKEALQPNQRSGIAKPRKVVDCSKKQSIKKDKAAKWIFKRRGADEEENLQLQTDECNSHLSGEKQQQKAKKKRKPETICNQDLCNQMSESDGRNSSRRITDKQDKDKLRGGLITDEEKLETCDGPDAGEIRKRKKKKSKTEQVTVPAVEATQEHGRCMSVKPAASQLTSTATESSWTIIAALPAFGNPQMKSTVVICKGILEAPSTAPCSSDAHDKGESKKKRKEKLKRQQLEVPIVELNNESGSSPSVESVETPLTAASVGNMMQKMIPALITRKESKKGKGELKTQQMEVPIVETNDERSRSHSVEPVETLLTSASIGNMIQKIIPALLMQGYSKLNHGIAGSEDAPAVPGATIGQSDACHSGEIKKKKKNEREKGEGSCVNESVRRRLFCAQDDNANNKRIPSALSTDRRPKLKHDFVESEETFELPSDLSDSGEIKKKKKMKGKKKAANVEDSVVGTNGENVRSLR